MAYIDKWALAVNQENIDRVMMAMVDVSLFVMDTPGQDAKLYAYAAACLNSPIAYAERMILGVVFTAGGVADADIRAAVIAVFPAYAGVEPT